MRLVQISRQAVPNEVFLHIANLPLLARLPQQPLPRTQEMVGWEDLHLHREGIHNESAAYQDFWRCAYRTRLAAYIHKNKAYVPLANLAREASYDTTSQLRAEDISLRKLLARRGVY